MEFIPRPFQILEKARNLPNRWAQRIAPFVDDIAFTARTAFPGLKNVGVRGLAPKAAGLARVGPVTQQIYGLGLGTTRLMQGAPAYKVGLGYATALPSALGWAALGADLVDSGISAIPGNVDIEATKQGLEKYGFDEGFELGEPNADGSIPVVRSDAGKAEDFLKTQKDAWLAKTANSPAANAGFGPDVRWQLHQKNQDFQEAKRTGTLDDFAAKYPDSQTAKRMNWNPRQGRPF